MDNYQERINRLSPEKKELLALRLNGTGPATLPAEHGLNGSTSNPVQSQGVRLVAYVVPAAGQQNETALIEELRQHLQQKLPAYMAPGQFILLEHLPLTPNGKIDRKALPDPNAYRAANPKTLSAPRDDVEQVIVEVWQKLLQFDEVSVEDNFFELGGHSLLMTRMLAQIGDRLGVDIPVQAFFQAPTVADLAQLVGALRSARPPGSGSTGPRETFEL